MRLRKSENSVAKRRLSNHADVRLRKSENSVAMRRLSNHADVRSRKSENSVAKRRLSNRRNRHQDVDLAGDCGKVASMTIP